MPNKRSLGEPINHTLDIIGHKGALVKLSSQSFTTLLGITLQKKPKWEYKKLVSLKKKYIEINLNKINTIEPKQRTTCNSMWQQLEQIFNSIQIERSTWKTMLFKAM